jgi:hypothetical protein
MHKSLILVLTLAFCAPAAHAAAQALTPAERAFFDQHISEIVQIEPKRLVDPALQKVFATPFYEVTVTIRENNGMNTNTLIAARVGSQLVNATRPGEDAELPDFLKMMNPVFKLATSADARTLQQALDAAYPILGSDDQKAKTYRRAGNQWIFVRGVFFDNRQGFVFETDSTGAIVAVKYALKLPA